MSYRRIGLVIAVALACGSAVMGQQSDGGERRDRDRGGRDGSDGRGGWRGRNWGGGGGRGPGSWNPTPEQREQFYSDMVDRYMERLTETYGLSPIQQLQARQKLEQYKTQASATAEERMQKRREAREQFSKLRERQEAGEEVSRDEWRAAGEQMRGAWPALMDRDLVVGDVEKLLPAAQVAQGRERRERERAEREAEWRERRERFRERDRERDGGNAAGADGDRDSERGERRGFRGRGDRDGRNEASWRDSWERYTENFSRRYQFDASQQASAQSILRDLLDRRKQYEDAHQTEYAALQQIADRAQRQAQSDALNAPIAQLFEELKTKLNQLPTTAQRNAAGPATRPSGSTRPEAGERRDERRRNRDSDRRPRGSST